MAGSGEGLNTKKLSWTVSQHALQRFQHEEAKPGRRQMSAPKTYVMAMGYKTLKFRVMLTDCVFENVESFNYFSRKISLNRQRAMTIYQRWPSELLIATPTDHSLRKCWIYHSLAHTILSYNCETWPVCASDPPKCRFLHILSALNLSSTTSWQLVRRCHLKAVPVQVVYVSSWLAMYSNIAHGSSSKLPFVKARNSALMTSKRLLVS